MCVSRKYSDPQHEGYFNCNSPTPSDFPFPQDKVHPSPFQDILKRYLPPPVTSGNQFSAIKSM